MDATDRPVISFYWNVTPEAASAFTSFVGEHGDSLLRYARLLFADAHEAEDGLQTALLRVAQNWQSAAAAPVGYTRTALRNLAIDGGRRRHLVPVPSDDEPQIGAAADLADITDASAAAARLDALLAGLPPKQRLTVLLRVIDGMSEGETAAAMGCAVGTVKSNLSRGLAALRVGLSHEQSQERATS